MNEYSETDEKILVVAKELFIENGLINTEMKDIAQKVGIGRSTLYRHFSSKESILFIIANQSLVKLMNFSNMPVDREFENGYEAVCYQLHTMLEGMISNVSDVVFLRDFDFFFTQDFPQGEEVTKFERYIQRVEGMQDLRKSFYRGMEDGSVTRVENPELTLLAIIHGCFAITQRILPREKHYIIELGYSREIIRTYLELVLKSIKSN